MKPRAIAVLIAALSFAGTALAGGSPAELYTLNCWGCHKPRAEGIPGTVPRLANSMGYFLHVPGGREYLVEVPGVAASSLSDAEIAEVLNWLLHTFNKAETPADFRPYTAAEVAKYRSHQLIEITETRGRLVKQLKAKGLGVPDDQLAGEALAAPLARH
ncbi:MAG TPA: cytochrome c [Candidatus Binataceae bacterium]|jgi:mono/diheme cytochrome c family protein